MSVFKPKVRGSFSERNGMLDINTIIQKNELDERTRICIINLLDDMFDKLELNLYLSDAYKYIYLHIFNVTSDDIPYNYSDQWHNIVMGLKLYWSYDEIFSFLESFLSYYSSKLRSLDVYDKFNDLFKMECVGYRFVNKMIVDIIDDIEIDELQSSLDSKYSAPKKCITKALSFLYDREHPDYSNSVKESISAIESMCNIILGTKNTILSKALKKLETNGLVIHPSLLNAFNSIYGYTSDESGIRHNGGIDEKTTFEEARFMLITCSAFLNYLISVYES